MEEIKATNNLLDSKAEKSVARFSKILVGSMYPEIKKAKELLSNFTADVSNKTLGINSKMIEIDNKLINFHVGRAIREYVYTGIVCLLIGIFGTLAVTQMSYGSLLKMSYSKEIEKAEENGSQEYQKKLIENNSGIIEIKRLERDYVRNHKKTYKNPDDYLQYLNKSINDLCSSESFKD